VQGLHLTVRCILVISDLRSDFDTRANTVTSNNAVCFVRAAGLYSSSALSAGLGGVLHSSRVGVTVSWCFYMCARPATHRLYSDSVSVQGLCSPGPSDCMHLSHCLLRLYCRYCWYCRNQVPWQGTLMGPLTKRDCVWHNHTSCTAVNVIADIGASRALKPAA
jgi:hypothetical protein